MPPALPMGLGMEDIEGRSEAPRVITLGEGLVQIGERFDTDGALGVVLIDAPGLSAIERNHGGAAKANVFTRYTLAPSRILPCW